MRYCSSACRRRGVKRFDRWLEQELLAMLEQRARGKTLCPSELARRLKPEAEEWRRLLEPVRMAARRLHHRGALEIIQSGRVTDPDTARGLIRLRQPRGIP